MRFFYTNLFDTATLTESSEASGLPVENAQNEHATKVWRTSNSLTTEYVVGDWGTAQAATAVIIHAHTILATDSSIKFQMHTADSWGSPDLSVDLTRVANTFGAVFASTSKRYFRFVFDKATAASTRDIGRIFVGTYLQPTAIPDFAGVDWKRVDKSAVDEAMGGEEYAETKWFRNEFKIPFSAMKETDFANMRTYYNAVGVYKPHFIQIDTVSPLDMFYYVRFAKDMDAKVKTYGSELYWNLTPIDYREMVMP